MNGPDPLASNGLPFVINSFTLDKVIAGDDAVNTMISTGNAPTYGPPVIDAKRTDQMPLTFDVMTLAAGG
jgi:hypothetical protein